MRSHQLSVIISVYTRDKPEYFDKALRSVIYQTLKPTEIIVLIDGLINDELESIISDCISKYPDVIKPVRLPQNMGRGEALKVGITACNYENIALMDADDISLPFRFEKEYGVLVYNGYDVVGSWIEEFVSDNPNKVRLKRVPETDNAIKEFMKYRNAVNQPTVMFKKQAVLQAGNYQHFQYLEDYYLWIRMILTGAKFYNIQEPLVKFRVTKNTYLRRGDLSYLKNEINLFKFMKENQFIDSIGFLRGIGLRFFPRICPPNIREIIYHLLRKIQ
jgi:glycosyltransferase involved in cell wall biosynthesis